LEWATVTRSRKTGYEFLFFWVLPISLSIFGAILVALEAGWRIGGVRHERDPSGATAGTGAIDGAIFGLMGLLLAFAFSGAASRFDTRRSLILEESNTIGTAYLRLDLLPAEAQVNCEFSVVVRDGR
jgi:hypothetical protein